MRQKASTLSKDPHFLRLSFQRDPGGAKRGLSNQSVHRAFSGVRVVIGVEGAAGIGVTFVVVVVVAAAAAAASVLVLSLLVVSLVGVSASGVAMVMVVLVKLAYSEV